MANNRMFLFCLNDGKEFLLANRYLGEYFTRVTNENEPNFESRLNSFLGDHKKCGDQFKSQYENDAAGSL